MIIWLCTLEYSSRWTGYGRITDLSIDLNLDRIRFSMMNRGILCKITSKAQAAASINHTTDAGGEPVSTEQLPPASSTAHPASSTAMRPARAANCLLAATATTTRRASSTNSPATANHQSEERTLYETNTRSGCCLPGASVG